MSKRDPEDGGSESTRTLTRVAHGAANELHTKPDTALIPIHPTLQNPQKNHFGQSFWPNLLLAMCGAGCPSEFASTETIFGNPAVSRRCERFEVATKIAPVFPFAKSAGNVCFHSGFLDFRS